MYLEYFAELHSRLGEPVFWGFLLIFLKESDGVVEDCRQGVS
jgi:hypothetical protein